MEEERVLISRSHFDCIQLTLAVGAVQIVQPSGDVYSQVASEIQHDEDLSHVIELYDFPSSFKTEDLFTGQ